MSAAARQPVPMEGEFRQSAYAQRRAAWRAEVDAWLATRPLPGTPKTLIAPDASAARMAAQIYLGGVDG